MDNTRGHTSPSHGPVIEVGLYLAANFNVAFFICIEQGLSVKDPQCCLALAFVWNKRERLTKGFVHFDAGLDTLKVIGRRSVYRDAAILGKVKMHDPLSLGYGAEQRLHLGLKPLPSTATSRNIGRIFYKSRTAFPLRQQRFYQEDLLTVINLARCGLLVTAIKKRAEGALLIEPHHVLIALATFVLFCAAAKPVSSGIGVDHRHVVEIRHLNKLVRLIQYTLEHP